MPRAKKRQKKDPGVLSAAVQPESVEMWQRLIAAVLERYASSRSPPDHLLYQILKIVPVCGGGVDLMVDGSTCGRAGRRFLRISFVFFAGGSTSDESFEVVVRALEVSGEEERLRLGERGLKAVGNDDTSAIL